MATLCSPAKAPHAHPVEYAATPAHMLASVAWAMIFVVVEEIIPESQSSGNGDLATLGVMVGFTVMMVHDVALG